MFIFLADIIVTTPNKLIYELNKMDETKKTNYLKNLNWLVVDESDRIFDNTEEDQSFRKQVYISAKISFVFIVLNKNA